MTEIIALQCVACGSNLEQIEDGRSRCTSCQTVNVLMGIDNVLRITSEADGEVEVEIPKIIAVGLFLRNALREKDLLVSPHDYHWRPDVFGTEWLQEHHANLYIGKKVTETKEEPKTFAGFNVGGVNVIEKHSVSIRANLIFGRNLITIKAEMDRVQEAREIGELIERSLGFVVKAKVSSAV